MFFCCNRCKKPLTNTNLRPSKIKYKRFSYSQKNKDRYMNSIGGGVPANVNVTVNVDGREAVTKQLNAFAEKNLVHHYNIETN